MTVVQIGMTVALIDAGMIVAPIGVIAVITDAMFAIAVIVAPVIAVADIAAGVMHMVTIRVEATVIIV